MKTTNTSEEINRRRFLGMAAMSIAGVEFIGTSAANAQFRTISSASPGRQFLCQEILG